jgi:DNA-binding PadR family transcriptional regulator
MDNRICYSNIRIGGDIITQIEMVLLALLQEKDYYAYEMESMIDQRNMREWTNIGFSSIYHCLNKLEKKGFIGSRYEKEYGSPKRKVYFIQEETKQILKERLIQLLSEYNPDPRGFDIGMAFSYLLSKEQLYHALIVHKENLIDRKAFVQKKYNEHPTANQRPHIKALFERPIAFLDTEIQWTHRFIEENFYKGEENNE